MQRMRVVFGSIVLAGVLAACGGGDGGGNGDAAGGGPDPAAEGAFPVTIEHKYGETVIPEPPQRVVSVGFADQDAILALGVVPVAIRDWYGEQPHAVWPWAQDELDALGGGDDIEVLAADALNFEAIAALRPDLIVGVSSGMTEEEYETLSAIAPTLAQSDEFIDYGVPWQDAQRVIGEALGRTAEADALIAETEALFAAARAANPGLAGATGIVAYSYNDGTIGAYGPQDSRSRILTDLGLTIPAAIVEQAGDQFYADFSAEEIELLTADALVWIAGSEAEMDALLADPLREGLPAAAEGREVFFDTLEEGGAASFSSVLSFPFLFETFIPELAAAADGDPAT